MGRLERAGWFYSISGRVQFWVSEGIAQMPEGDRQLLEDYPGDGEAQIAQRIVARLTRLLGTQAELFLAPGRPRRARDSQSQRPGARQALISFN